MNGFYVPDSVSSSYVANKRNEEGSLLYESAANEIGIQKQAAIQQLEKSYASTIENAYASYLAANRGVEASQMGQGYKELYKQIQQEQLQQNIANTYASLAEQRATLETQEAAAQEQIKAQFEQEVGYLDRVQQSFADYLTYAKTLTHSTTGETYLDIDEMQQSVDSMYNVLSAIQPQAYLDEEGNIGMTYEEWARAQLGTSEADTAYRQWLFGGGLNEFLNAPKSVRQYGVGELANTRKENEALQKELINYVNGSTATQRVQQYLAEHPNEAEQLDKERQDNIQKEEQKKKNSSSMNSMLV